MRRFFMALCAVAAFFSLPGCSTLADAQSAKGTGTVRVYEKPYDVVWSTVLASVKETNLALVSENKGNGAILAQGAASAFSWGENVAIYVEDLGGKVKTRVEIINKRAVATNVMAPDWEKRLASTIDARLAATSK